MATVHVPRPCPVGQSALIPTATGWHCAACQHEVIDFTRLTDAEVMEYLAARAGQRVCARVAAPTTAPRHPKRARGARRWLSAVLALMGTGPHLAHGALPPLPPMLHRPLQLKSWRMARLVVRGTVLDDSLNVPVAGAYVFIQGTRYGAITDERGEFSFSISSGSKLLKDNALILYISADSFTFWQQTVAVSLADGQEPTPVLVRLRSLPDRGHIMGKVRLTKPPVPPPGSQPH